MLFFVVSAALRRVPANMARRRDTLSLVFEKVAPVFTPMQVMDFMEKQLRLKEEEVVGIQLEPNLKRVFIKLKDGKRCEEVANYGSGKYLFTHGNGTMSTVEVMCADLGNRLVRILKLPFEVSNEGLGKVLSAYGRLTSPISEEMFDSKHKYKVKTGTRSVRMDLAKPIPSYLVVEGQRALILYPGQAPTCMLCNKSGHIRKFCDQDSSSRAWSSVVRNGKATSESSEEPEVEVVDTFDTFGRSHSNNNDDAEPRSTAQGSTEEASTEEDKMMDVLDSIEIEQEPAKKVKCLFDASGLVDEFVDPFAVPDPPRPRKDTLENNKDPLSAFTTPNRFGGLMSRSNSVSSVTSTDDETPSGSTTEGVSEVDGAKAKTPMTLRSKVLNLPTKVTKTVAMGNLKNAISNPRVSDATLKRAASQVITAEKTKKHATSK